MRGFGVSRLSEHCRPLMAESDVFENTFMPTTVHIPGRLLAAVDRRAKALKVSRNRLRARQGIRDAF